VTSNDSPAGRRRFFPFSVRHFAKNVALHPSRGSWGPRTRWRI
jgi:hypothetical protein